MESHLDDLPDGITVPHFTGKYAASLLTQLRVGVGRAVRTAWRSREDIRTRVMKNTIMAVLIGTSFLQLGKDQSGLSNRFVVVFFAVMLNSLNGGSVLPVVTNERAVFYREDASKAIRPFVYPLSLTLSISSSLHCSFLSLSPSCFLDHAQVSPWSHSSRNRSHFFHYHFPRFPSLLDRRSPPRSQSFPLFLVGLLYIRMSTNDMGTFLSHCLSQWRSRPRPPLSLHVSLLSLCRVHDHQAPNPQLLDMDVLFIINALSNREYISK